jgi:hypothetical protein
LGFKKIVLKSKNLKMFSLSSLSTQNKAIIAVVFLFLLSIFLIGGDDTDSTELEGL